MRETGTQLTGDVVDKRIKDLFLLMVFHQLSEDVDLKLFQIYSLLGWDYIDRVWQGCSFWKTCADSSLTSLFGCDFTYSISCLLKCYDNVQVSSLTLLGEWLHATQDMVGDPSSNE